MKKKKKITDKKRRKIITDYNDFVIGVYRKVGALIDLEIMKYEENAYARWMLRGRILNLLFGAHYKVSIKKAEEAVREKEKK